MFDRKSERASWTTNCHAFCNRGGRVHDGFLPGLVHGKLRGYAKESLNLVPKVFAVRDFAIGCSFGRVRIWPFLFEFFDPAIDQSNEGCANQLNLDGVLEHCRPTLVRARLRPLVDLREAPIGLGSFQVRWRTGRGW
jgi:hypothetical protein